MQILNSFNYRTQYSAPKQTYFGGSREKLIQQILDSRPKHVQMTTESLTALLRGEGFEVNNSGNFLIAKKEGEVKFRAAHSNGHRKFIDPQAISRLKTMLQQQKK